MKKTITAVLIAAAWIVLNPVSARAAASEVYRFDDGSPVLGASSTLATSDQGARMTLQTSELPAGHTVTIWWVVFNAPQNCRAGVAPMQCGAGDLPVFGGDDSAETSLLYAAGHQVGGSGRATFSGRLATGDDSDALWGPGLTNPTGAEIHLVVHDHGELTPEQRAEGIHNFGPCNPCVDLQFSPHVQ